MFDFLPYLPRFHFHWLLSLYQTPVCTHCSSETRSCCPFHFFNTLARQINDSMIQFHFRADYVRILDLMQTIYVEIVTDFSDTANILAFCAISVFLSNYKTNNAKCSVLYGFLIGYCVKFWILTACRDWSITHRLCFNPDMIEVFGDFSVWFEPAKWTDHDHKWIDTICHNTIDYDGFFLHKMTYLNF